MMHKAKDLSADQKQVLESLLGRQVLEQETISVRAFESPAISDEQRQQVANELRQLFAEADANRRSATDDEVSSAVTEAMRSTRPGYQSRS